MLKLDLENIYICYVKTARALHRKWGIASGEAMAEKLIGGLRRKREPGLGRLFDAAKENRSRYGGKQRGWLRHLLAEEGVLVVLTTRSEKRGEAACRKLQEDAHDVRFHPLDVTEEDAPKKLAVFIEAEFGRLDILVNNAAILLDERLTALTLGTDSLRKTMETNLYGPLRICQALAPLMKLNSHGRIVNVSSGYGSLKEMRGGGYVGYRISKAALNALTCILSDDLRGTGILVNAACPGWVQTDMGGRRSQVSRGRARHSRLAGPAPRGRTHREFLPGSKTSPLVGTEKEGRLIYFKV